MISKTGRGNHRNREKKGGIYSELGRKRQILTHAHIARYQGRYRKYNLKTDKEKREREMKNRQNRKRASQTGRERHMGR